MERDEPGRVVIDDDDRAHVVLRGGKGIVSVDLHSGAAPSRRPVCPVPRGIAYQPGFVDGTAPARPVVHVACMDGELVTLPVKEDGGAVKTRRLAVDDLRDVVFAPASIGEDRLYVTRFRSAEILVVELDGTVSKTIRPARANKNGDDFAPSVGWRALPLPPPVAGSLAAARGPGLAILHQRAKGVPDPNDPGASIAGGNVKPLLLGPEAYLNGSCDGGASVHATVSYLKLDASTTEVAAGTPPRVGGYLQDALLAVDMAFAPDGETVAVVAAGTNKLMRVPIVPHREQVCPPKREPAEDGSKVVAGSDRRCKRGGADLCIAAPAPTGAVKGCSQTRP